MSIGVKKVLQAKRAIKCLVPEKRYYKLVYFFQPILSLIYHKDLNALAVLYGSDKFGEHNYTEIYNVILKPFKNKKVTIFEIGVGGYNNENVGAASLKMWKSYFKNSKVVGLDIEDKRGFQESRISIYQGDQSSKKVLNKIVDNEGPFDIIIDDGSHINSHIISSFKVLFSSLKSGGLYIIEDTHTSYDPRYGGSEEQINEVKSAINYFKNIPHLMHGKRSNLPEYEGIDGVRSISFYPKLIVIQKT